MNLLELLQATTRYFQKHEIESPRLNAELLVAHALKLKRLDLYLLFDRPMSDAELGPLREKVRERAQGKPLQHLLGTVEFYGRTLKVDTRALIPRPETEQLIEQVLARAKEARRFADVGTGTGAIALTLAGELPEAQVDGFDVSPDALALARENAAALGLGERVQFFESDLLEKAGGRYGCIVANLPYIATEVIPTLTREVQWDPRLALDGGPDGLDLVRRLLEAAPAFLEPGGLLALELGHDQADAVIALAEAVKYNGAGCTSDYQGVRRFFFANYG